MDLTKYDSTTRSILETLDRRRQLALKAQLEAADPDNGSMLAAYVEGVLHCMRDITGDWDDFRPETYPK